MTTTDTDVMEAAAIAQSDRTPVIDVIVSRDCASMETWRALDKVMPLLKDQSVLAKTNVRPDLVDTSP